MRIFFSIVASSTLLTSKILICLVCRNESDRHRLFNFCLNVKKKCKPEKSLCVIYINKQIQGEKKSVNKSPKKEKK